MQAPKYPTRCVERFLEYVRVDTQSREDSPSFPSTPGQLVLLRKLERELVELGLDEVVLDEHGYLFATIPATSPKREVPVIGFLAHVDTSPDMSGAGVEPIVHRDYRGQDLRLPHDPTAVIRLADNPALEEQMGHDIITASGNTLLGADNKAGVAEVVGAAEYLIAHREIPHGKVRIGFTPDEEIGQGTKHFDVARFGASCAYTMDGERLGELQTETFSADTLILTFHGFNTHPGFAKGRMINPLKVAAEFIHLLPRDRMSPETTEGYAGYVHPHVVDSGMERTAVRLLLRSFSTPGLGELREEVERLAAQAVAAWPGSRFESEVRESYRNMKEVLAEHPQVVEHARQAIRRAGLTPHEEPIRGGTDGSRLSFMGLPTPNIFAGEHNFHSKLEWVSTHDMHKAVEVIVELCKIWEERAPR